MKYSEIIARALEPDYHWDDWNDYRDSFRDLGHYGICHPTCDICKAKQEKIKKQLEIRKAKLRKNEFFIKDG